MRGSLKLFSLVVALAIAGCNAGGSSSTPTSGAPSQAGSSASAHFVPEWQPSMKPGVPAITYRRRAVPRISCDQGHKAKLLAVRRQLRLAASRLTDSL